MIENFFEHPYTLRYLRSGVTGPHIGAFAVTLTEQGFTKDRARGLLRGVAHLGRWLQNRRTPLVALHEGILETFRAHLSRCRCVRPNQVGSTTAAQDPTDFWRGRASRAW
jgi:hypothetical protein